MTDWIWTTIGIIVNFFIVTPEMVDADFIEEISYVTAFMESLDPALRASGFIVIVLAVVAKLLGYQPFSGFHLRNLFKKKNKATKEDE